MTPPPNPSPQKYPLQTTFWKHFEGYGDFQGTVMSYDPVDGYYHVVYLDDDDEEELTQDDLDVLLSSSSSSRAQSTRTETPPTTTTGVSRSGRTIQRVSYQDDHYEESASEDDDDDDDSVVGAPSRRSAQKQRKSTQNGSTKRNHNQGPTAAAMKIMMTPAMKIYDERDHHQHQHHVDEDDDEEVWTALKNSDSWDDLLAPPSNNDSNNNNNNKKNATFITPTPRRRNSSTTNATPKSSYPHILPMGNDNDNDNNDATTCTWEPLTAPVYPDLSWDQLRATKDQFLDPRGTRIDATTSRSSIVQRIVGDQVVQVGGLLTRALSSGGNSKNTDNKNVRLGTACTATDAPAVALKLLQEQIQQRLLQNGNDTDDTEKGPLLQYSHEFCGETDPLTLGFLKRQGHGTSSNVVVYRDISKRSSKEGDGATQSLPDINWFVAGTASCNNTDLFDKKGERTGETFVDMVEVLLKKQPTTCLLETSTDAPHQQMSDYISGRVRISDLQAAANKKKKETAASSNNTTELWFSANTGGKIVCEQAPAECGVRPGSTVTGFLKGTQGKIYPIKMCPDNNNKTGKKQKAGKNDQGDNWCTLDDLIRHNNISKATDTVVFDRPVTYHTHWVEVDTKDYGLPQTRPRVYMFVWQPEKEPEPGYVYEDDLGIYWEALVRHLESPAKHALDAFLLPPDNEYVRRFREALKVSHGLDAKRRVDMEDDFWTSTDDRLSHHKAVRELSGIDETARSVTNWGPSGKKKAAPHYWLEYMECIDQRQMDMIDILHAQAARDAETKDSNFASHVWNISESIATLKHRNVFPGISGCITPSCQFFLPHLGRPMLGVEKLLVQGVPYRHLSLGNETDAQLGDLAANAMSLTVVSAKMLAALVAAQLRSEMVKSTKKNSGENGRKRKFTETDQSGSADADAIRKYLESLKADDASRCLRKWLLVEEIDDKGRHDSDKSSIGFFHELAQLAPDAAKTAVWCTCETSGTLSRTDKFIQCKICSISCCRACMCENSGYNLSAHDTTEIVLAGDDVDVRYAKSFESKLTSILPQSLYLSKEGVDQIAAADEDRFRVAGLDQYTFCLHFVKKDRKKWVITYYARDRVGQAVAELRIVVGEIRRGHANTTDNLGLKAELTSFMAALTEPLQYGKLPPCAYIVVPVLNDADTKEAHKKTPLSWFVRKPSSAVSVQISGQNETPSNRIDCGLDDRAPAMLEDNCNAPSNKQAFSAAVERGEERRWLYPKNWQTWPELIRIRCFEDGLDKQVPGLYKRAACRQTTNQSALWIKKSNGKQQSPSTPQSSAVYLLLKPNVNSTGPDQAVVSTSMDHDDASCILAEIDRKWQPCDAFEATLQLQNAVSHKWGPLPGFACKVLTIPGEAVSNLK